MANRIIVAVSTRDASFVAIIARENTMRWRTIISPMWAALTNTILIPTLNLLNPSRLYSKSNNKPLNRKRLSNKTQLLPDKHLLLYSLLLRSRNRQSQNRLPRTPSTSSSRSTRKTSMLSMPRPLALIDLDSPILN
jgi:hypothetical protein